MQTTLLSKKLNRSYWMVMLSMCFLISCSVTKTTKAVSESTAYMTLAKEKLGNNVKFDFNKDRSYVLCQSKVAATSNSKSFSFFVFDMKNEEAVIEQNVNSGFVKWLSNLEIEVFTTPGFMRNDQSRDEFTQVYHVVTGKSTPKTDWGK